MQIRTDRNDTISIDFAFAPTMSGNMVIKMPDEGKALSEICAAFENVDRFECREEKREGSPAQVYEGYRRLMRVSREGGAVMLTLSREE